MCARARFLISALSMVNCYSTRRKVSLPDTNYRWHRWSAHFDATAAATAAAATAAVMNINACWQSATSARWCIAAHYVGPTVCTVGFTASFLVPYTHAHPCTDFVAFVPQKMYNNHGIVRILCPVSCCEMPKRRTADSSSMLCCHLENSRAIDIQSDARSDDVVWLFVEILLSN